jgi:RNA polymerase sigma-70 factor (ECF subfamily)
LKEEDTHAMLAKQLILQRIPRSATFEIRCFSSRPAEAAEIANKVAEVFCASPPGAKASLIERATPPRQHVRPNEPLNLAFAATVGLVLGIVVAAGVLLVASIRPPRLNQAAKPPIDLSATQPATSKEAEGARAPRDSGWVLAARWMARGLSVGLLAFYGFFVLAEGLPPITSQPEGVQLNFVALGMMLLGFVVGWKREGAAALLIASGWTLWHISEGRMQWNLFQTPLPVAALYGFCWWATHGRRTGVVVTAVATLAVCLGLGRLFVPTSVFVRGTIIDGQTGKPVSNAELRLLPRSSHSLEKRDSPNARANADGEFTLYVGWYEKQRELAISATGYGTVTTNLGPRSLGQRSISRSFQLQPAMHSLDAGDVSVPPVVVLTVPESGTANVDPALKEIRVTFSEPMQAGGGSWAKWTDDSFPQMRGQARFLEDGRTCVLPVQLRPGKVYAIWINSEKHRNFKDQQGQSAVPYLLIFQTRK